MAEAVNGGEVVGDVEDRDAELGADTTAVGAWREGVGVDSGADDVQALAERLSTQRPDGLAPLSVCLQVNVSAFDHVLHHRAVRDLGVRVYEADVDTLAALEGSHSIDVEGVGFSICRRPPRKSGSAVAPPL